MNKIITRPSDFYSWAKDTTDEPINISYSLDVSNTLVHSAEEGLDINKLIHYLVAEEGYQTLAKASDNGFVKTRAKSMYEETVNAIDYIVLERENIYVEIIWRDESIMIMGPIGQRLGIELLAERLINKFVKLNPLWVPPTAPQNKGKIYFMMVDRHGELMLRSFKLTVPETPINLCYSNDFLNKDHDKIVHALQIERPGIHLFHGEPGTGKTTYIRQLTQLVDRRFIFMPTNFGEILSNPQFLTFIMQYPESIIVMEDAEVTIKQREKEGNHNAIANVLNMADGLLGDVLRCQFIFTFNCPFTEIDNAISRPGRCLSNIKFDKLDVEKSNDLAAFLKIERKFEEPATIAEVACGNI